MGYIETMAGASIAKGLENAYDKYLSRKDYREEQRRKAEIHQAQMDIIRPQQLNAQIDTLNILSEMDKMVNKVNSMDQQFEAVNFRQYLENFAGDPYGDNQQLLHKLKSTPIGQQLFGSITNIEPAMLNYSPQALEQTAKEQGIDLNEIYEEPYNWTVITENTQNGSSYRYLAPLDGIYATMGGSKARFDIFNQAGKRSYEKFMAENPDIASIYKREPKQPDINSLYDENGNLNLEDAYRKGLIDPSKSEYVQSRKDLMLKEPEIQLGNKSLDYQLKQKQLENINLDLEAKKAYADKEGLASLVDINNRGRFDGDTAKMKNINDTITRLKSLYPNMSDRELYLFAEGLTSNDSIVRQQTLNDLSKYDKSSNSTEDIFTGKITDIITEYKPKEDPYIISEEVKNIEKSNLINKTILGLNYRDYRGSERTKLQKRENLEKLKINYIFDIGSEGIKDLLDPTKKLDYDAISLAKEIAVSSGEGDELYKFINEIAADDKSRDLADSIIKNKDLDKVTGVVDSIIASAVQYIPTENAPENIKASLETLKTTLGKNLMTGALSNTDMKRLDNIVGSDFMQSKSILSKLKGALQNVLVSLETKSNIISDPFVRQVYVGRNIAALKHTIALIDNKIQGKTIDSKKDSQGREYTIIPKISKNYKKPVDISNYTEDQIRQLPKGTMVVKKDKEGNIIGSGRVK